MSLAHPRIDIGKFYELLKQSSSYYFWYLTGSAKYVPEDMCGGGGEGSLCAQARREHLIPWVGVTGTFAGFPACYVGVRTPTLAHMIVQQAT